MTIKVMEPLSLAMALPERGREQFASQSTAAARSARCPFMSGALGRGAVEERGVRNLLAALAIGGGAFGGEATLVASTSFFAGLVAVRRFFPLLVLLLCLAGRTSGAALLNSLVPPTISASDCVGI